MARRVIQGVLGGRFISPEDIATELERLRAPSGDLGLLGNHDAWLDHDRVERPLERHGVRILEETTARLETAARPVWVAGISDVWTGPHDIAAALAAAPPAITVLTLMPEQP